MINISVTELVIVVCLVGALVALALIGFLLPGEKVDDDTDDYTRVVDGHIIDSNPLGVLERRRGGDRR